MSGFWLCVLLAATAADDRKGTPPKLEHPSANDLLGSARADAGVVKLPERTQVTAPAQVALPGYRLHLFASEELHPDALRLLTRPNVTLWLDTRSNMLRDSTLENLRRASESYVRFHPPVTDVQAKRFSGAAASGVWLDANELGGQGVYRLGGRALAVELSGAGEPAQWRKLQSARPSFTWWSAIPCEPTAFQSFRGLSGRKVMVAPSFDCKLRPPDKARIAVRAADVKLPEGANPDQLIVWIRADASPETVRTILVQHPNAELAVTVGANEQDARKLAVLLDALEQKKR